MKELIDAMDKAFPQKDGGYTCAVFFHHDPDGKLKACSPMIGGMEKQDDDLALIMVSARLVEYSKTCFDTAMSLSEQRTNMVKINTDEDGNS